MREFLYMRNYIVEKSFLPKRDMEWFFFCPRDRKYPNGSRTNRATRVGYWKATGKDRKVVCQASVIGYRKTLVFYRGRAPAGDRTDWVMHEYRLSDDVSQGSPSSKGPFALCRIIKKNEQALKTSDNYGDPKAKQVGSCSSNGDFSSTRTLNEPVIIADDVPFQESYIGSEKNYSTTLTSPYQTTTMVETEQAPMRTSPSRLWLSPDFILDSSKEYPQGQEGVSGYFPQNEFPNSMTPWQPYEHFEISPSSSHSNFTEKVELHDDFIHFSSMSPYSGQGDYTGFFGNGSISHEGYGWSNSLNPSPF